jgi:hypothetical protein
LVSSGYLFGIFWLPLWYLLVTPLVSSDYSFGNQRGNQKLYIEKGQKIQWPEEEDYKAINRP